jgi:hypothetical protein
MLGVYTSPSGYLILVLRPQRLQKSNTTNVLEPATQTQEQRLYQGLQLSRSINVYGQEGCCIDQRETRIKYELGRVA